MRRTPQRRAFTLLELIIVVLISGSMSIVLALFLQRGVSVYSRVEDEAQLVGRVRFGLDRLRKCARHSISGFCNWVGTAPASFDYCETLFFLTDLDQNGHREAHFVWFDRGSTNNVIHAWKEAQDPSWALAGLSGLSMPPDMSGGSFTSLLSHLRGKSNFWSSGVSSAQRGWEVLFESLPTVPPAQMPNLPVYVGRFYNPIPPPTPAWGTSPPYGLAFLVDKIVKVSPGSPNPTWTFDTTEPVISTTLYKQLAGAGAPYARPANRLGSPTCQIYLSLFVDRNASYVLDPEEASVRLLTSINTLLIPSAGTATP